MRETWKPVIGYEGLYEVSDLGKVRSLPRVERLANRWGTTTSRPREGKVLANAKDTHGYLQVRLSKEGKARTLLLHRVVLHAFTGKLGAEGCHLNHDKTDNTPKNLAWGTRQENESQKSEAGRRPRNTRRLGSIAEVVFARVKRFEYGFSIHHIASLLGKSDMWVWGVCHGKVWREVP